MNYIRIDVPFKHWDCGFEIR